MNLSFLSQLGLAVTPDVRLADITTFKLGGPCLALVECRKAEDMIKAVRSLREENIPFLVMGFGANILASDHGVNQVIVRFTSPTPWVAEISTGVLEVDAATQFDDLACFAVEHDLDGMAAFSGIPGTVGGAIAGNAGAYGDQIADCLSSVRLLKPDGTIIIRPRHDIRFSYRDSDIKHSDDIVLSATFHLAVSQDPTALKARRRDILAERESKFGNWKKDPCAGSFFRNLEPTSNASRRTAAGGILDLAGAKAMNVHGAHTYPNHANIVTRDEGATAQDVYELTLKMAAAVKEKFGLDLIREVRLLGKFDNASDGNAEGYW